MMHLNVEKYEKKNCIKAYFRKSVLIILTYYFIIMCIVQHGYYPMQLSSISVYCKSLQLLISL